MADPTESPQLPERSLVERVFADFLRAEGADGDDDFDQVCRQHPEFEQELRRLHANWKQLAGVISDLRQEDRRRQKEGYASGGALLDLGAEPPSSMLRRLRGRQHADDKYSIREEIESGGMGTIFRVKDQDLRRSLAMKVARLGTGLDELRSERVLSRFLEEAQITGQLDHPGVVPVHELGVDEEGQPFFTMQLVRGATLREVFAEAHAGSGGWTLPRALEVLLRVCDAMAYAHSKGVLHRDLKPANIMVGRFGETYVMDWGLACVLGEKDEKDIRLRDPEKTDLSQVLTERRALKQSDTDSPLLTMDGDIFGTPAYMSPEQAEGRIEQMGPASDVFSLGAMLYHLLSGQMPYVKEGQKASGPMVLRWVLDGPPKALELVQPGLPPELVAICEKAMARDQRERYQDTRELSEELRAFLEGRVVHAYRTGAWVELRKWVKRNRGIAALAAALLVVTLAGGAWLYAAEARAKRSALNETRAVVEAQAAKDHLVFEALDQRARDLWPNSEGTHAEAEAWLRDARALARSYGSGAGADVPLALRDWAASFEGAAAGGLIAEVDSRLEAAREWTRASLEADAWALATREIAQSSEYAGLDLAPQWGLVPLGADPRSGLHEFAHLPSGAPPERDGDRELHFGPDSGVVLVLIPAGTATLGSQKEDSRKPYYDPNTQPLFAGPVSAELDAYFLSKFELTQEQWLRMTGSNPSFYRINELAGGQVDLGSCHPVETVSWIRASDILGRVRLALPTEAQWEYAARARTDDMFIFGADADALHAFANVADESAARLTSGWEIVAGFDDGFPLHAPVHSLMPNPFGLHHVLGNVYEYCADPFLDYSNSTRAGDGLRVGESKGSYAMRGGSFRRALAQTRVALRVAIGPSTETTDIGIRPARRLDPD